MAATSSSFIARWLVRALWLVGLAAHLATLIVFLDWMLQTDIMFGHHQGPPTLIFVTIWLSTGALIVTAVWAAVFVYTRMRARLEAPAGFGRKFARVLGCVVQVGMALLSALLLLMAVSEVPRASLALHRQHIEQLPKKGAAAVPELLEALHDEDWISREIAVQSLGKIGPEARDAIPALVAIIKEAPSGSSPNPIGVWWALRAIDLKTAEAVGVPK